VGSLDITNHGVGRPRQPPKSEGTVFSAPSRRASPIGPGGRRASERGEGKENEKKIGTREGSRRRAIHEEFIYILARHG
jgi:hypothetical protein